MSGGVVDVVVFGLLAFAALCLSVSAGAVVEKVDKEAGTLAFVGLLIPLVTGAAIFAF